MFPHPFRWLRTAASMFVAASLLTALPAQTQTETVSPSLLPPPAPMAVPAPGPAGDGPYQPQPIVAGGAIIPLYPPDSPLLKPERLREPEKYHYYSPTEVGYVINIHNPSIEFHPGNGQLNTGACIILAAGGGHRTLNVGPEGADFVHFFKGHGISTVILRNRLRSDGYDPRIDGVNDTLQAVKLVRAHAKAWNLDPAKIGIMGFSAGAELASGAALFYPEFDRTHDVPANPLAKVTSRPDFVGIIYPGPSPFARGGSVPIPRDAPPVFFATGGWGDWIHALWATEYFTALLKDAVPNVEFHVYARGRHPGDKAPPDEPPATGGLTNRGFTAFGSWQDQYIQWFRDLGFFGKPGVPTLAAKDVAANVDRKPRM